MYTRMLTYVEWHVGVSVQEHPWERLVFDEVETLLSVLYTPLSQSVKHGIQWSVCAARWCCLKTAATHLTKGSI